VSQSDKSINIKKHPASSHGIPTSTIREWNELSPLSARQFTCVSTSRWNISMILIYVHQS